MKKFERIGLFLLTGGVSELVLRPLEAVEANKKAKLEAYSRVSMRIISCVNLKKYIEKNAEKEVYDMYAQSLTAAQNMYKTGDVYGAAQYVQTCESIYEAIYACVTKD